MREQGSALTLMMVHCSTTMASYAMGLLESPSWNINTLSTSLPGESAEGHVERHIYICFPWLTDLHASLVRTTGYLTGGNSD